MDSVIDIDNNALDFIKQHGGVVTVRFSPKHGCCGGLTNVAVAETNSPSDATLYQRHRYQNITLFIDPALAYQGLNVEVEGLWKLRHLYINGLPLQLRHTDKQQR